VNVNVRRGAWQFLVIGLIVSLGLSIYADLGAVAGAFARFRWPLFFLALGLTVGNQFLRFLKWEYLLRRLDVKLDPWVSLQIFGSGLVMILTPGKLGEVWKSWLVKEVNSTPVSRTLPVVAVERLTDLIGVLLITFVGVIAFGRSIAAFLVLAGAVLASLLAIQYPPFVHFCLHCFERLPVVGKHADRLRRLYDNSRELTRPVPLLVTTALSVVSWGLECVGMWVVVRGFDAEVSLVVAAFVFASASILGALSLIPGGFGVTEGSMTGLLVYFGVSATTAASTTLVVRAATLWFVAAAAVLIYSQFRARRSTLFNSVNEKFRS
jgi:uncharacterized protein (TIRG00374 family)